MTSGRIKRSFGKVRRPQPLPRRNTLLSPISIHVADKVRIFTWSGGRGRRWPVRLSAPYVRPRAFPTPTPSITGLAFSRFWLLFDRPPSSQHHRPSLPPALSLPRDESSAFSRSCVFFSIECSASVPVFFIHNWLLVLSPLNSVDQTSAISDQRCYRINIADMTTRDF